MTEEELQRFIKERLPSSVSERVFDIATYDVISEAEKEQLREEGRQDILRQLAAKNIWEGRFVFKKKWINECLNHRRVENFSLRDYILNRILAHKRAYATPGVTYLLKVFNFEGLYLTFDSNFGSLEEQITFSLIEHLRKEFRDPARRVSL